MYFQFLNKMYMLLQSLNWKLQVCSIYNTVILGKVEEIDEYHWFEDMKYDSVIRNWWVYNFILYHVCFEKLNKCVYKGML